MIQNKVVVVGLGYVGLPTAVILASKNFHVVGYDIDCDIVKKTNTKTSHITENDVAELLEKVVSQGKLTASTLPEKANIFIIAVPTPLYENKQPNISIVSEAVFALAPYLEKGNLIILESTSPVGTTQKIAEQLSVLRTDLNFTHDSPDVFIAYCPERVLPGDTLNELMNNSRCIGGLTPEAAVMARKLYQTFCLGDLFITNAETAELSKLAENSFRDVNIAFANEIAKICNKHHINVHELIFLANKHPRVNILSPGLGVGGHCIPIDPWFLVESDEESLIKQARLINDDKPILIAKHIQTLIAQLSISTIGILGLTYKPDVDDFRGSPAFTVIEELAKNTALTICIHDPFIEKHKSTLPKSILFFEQPQDLLNHVQLVLIGSAHQMYDGCDFSEHMHKGTLIDPSGYVLKIEKAKRQVQKITSNLLEKVI